MTSIHHSVVEGISSSSRVHRWTREEFHRMADAGLFERQKFELLEGEVIEVAPMLSSHATAIAKLSEKLFAHLAALPVVIRVQCPIVLGDLSEPEPDFAIARGTADDYSEHHPIASDIQLLIEVSDSTLSDDRGLKLGIYAAHGVDEYWIVNLQHRQIEVYRQPQENSEMASGYGYFSRIIGREGMTVSPAFAPDLKIAVSEVLPAKNS